MITASELRLGNFVMDAASCEWMKVDELGENIGATILDRSKYPLEAGWQMAGIPLTPVVLERCGFKDRSGTLANRMGFGLSMNSVDELCWYVQDGFLRYQTKGAGFTRSYEHIRYLHQLQNFYVAQTGQELEVKL